MKIFTYNERDELIKATVDNGVNVNELVNRVGDGVAKEIMRRFPQGQKVIVFAGWGMKGAYSLSAARFLLQAGFAVETYLFNIGGNRLSNECYNAKYQLEKAFPKAIVHDIVQEFQIPELSPQWLVLDGLFGADLDRPLPRSFGMLIRSINESGAKIVSIEIPSGLFSEWNATNSISRDIIHASLTLAVEFPCLSFFIKENIPLVGEWKIIDVGLNRDAIRRMPYTFYLVTRHDTHCILRPRSADSSKADFGSALICAGSYGMVGAAVLATKGCLRAGVGKVTCYAPRCGFSILQTAVPSAMFAHDSHELYLSNIEPEHKYDAVAIGPGIGTAEITVNALEKFLKLMNTRHKPVVIDADALNCIALRPNMMNYIPEDSVLTPHEGEFDRIFGEHTSTEARIQRALEVAEFHNIVIVLKGRYTAIVRPDGRVHINSSGTPALATAGSGDVLTGIITSFMAQGYEPEIAAIIGVYIHGVAGELAEETHGDYGVTSEDVADCVGRAIKSIMEHK